MYVMEVACWSCACELSVSSVSCLPCVSAFSSFYWDRVCHLWPFDTYFNRHFILLLHSTAQSRRTAAATAAKATNWNCSQTSSVFLLGTNANCQIAQSKDWYETHSTMSVELCAVVCLYVLCRLCTKLYGFLRCSSRLGYYSQNLYAASMTYVTKQTTACSEKCYIIENMSYIVYFPRF